ncbi:hypothetical protein DTO021C3_1268 [Paecilomyces variotii]|nr:hypothetical protein DTO021C3_1268 [Paecilomyces variotii]
MASNEKGTIIDEYPVPSYSQVACVGTGLSAIALGATLKRWYDNDDIRFFERQSDCGGTWFINSYPGCACDVPSALYSFSFALNPNWTKLMPSNKEIKEYHDGVVKQYGLREKMVFHTEVRKCVWRDDANCWLLFLIDLETGNLYTHECQILFAATGQLIEPRPCDFPGASTFKGTIFHSARWDHSVNLEGKNVVVVGNGCTATQIVPSIVKKTKSLTQIVRSKHWVFPAHNFHSPKIVSWILRHVPFAMRLHRFHVFLVAENGWRLFPMTKSAARFREKTQRTIENYTRKTAPEKYHDILIPDFDVGCKRRIFDCGYLKSLHDDNLLLTDARITEIIPEGVKTTDGIIPADVIVLATGFQTNKFTSYMAVHGREGTIEDHWARYDGPEAYNCSTLSGFPNFFILLGPNSATGHTSALIAAENSVNYALRIMEPVLNGNAAAAEVKQEAEDAYAHEVQSALQNRVWNAGCSSWYINEKKWNSMSYPWTQAHYWYRSLFPVWSDWKIKRTRRSSGIRTSHYLLLLLVVSGTWVSLLERHPSLKDSLSGKGLIDAARAVIGYFKRTVSWLS